MPPGVRALLDSNGIDYAEIDVADDAAPLDWVRETARSVELPVVELDGRFAAGPSILALARTFDLKRPSRGPTSPEACC